MTDVVLVSVVLIVDRTSLFLVAEPLILSKQHYRSALDLFLHEIKNINVDGKRCLTI